MLQLGAEGWFEDFCCGHNNFHVNHLPTKILSLAKTKSIHFSFFIQMNQCLHFGYWIVWLTLAQNSGWNAQQGIVKMSLAGILWSFKSLPKEAWWLSVWFSPWCQRINECSTLPKVGKMSDTLRCDSFHYLKQLTAVVSGEVIPSKVVYHFVWELVESPFFLGFSELVKFSSVWPHTSNDFCPCLFALSLKWFPRDFSAASRSQKVLKLPLMEDCNRFFDGVFFMRTR